MRQLPHLQAVYEKYRDRGLHVFHVEAQHHPEGEIELMLREFGVTCPNPLLSWSDIPVLPIGRRFAEWGYYYARLPQVYLIGVDGKVVWHGTHGYDDALAAELEKVRYPGLFRDEFPSELEEAARAFGERRFGAAVAKASSVDFALAEDAQAILDKVAEVHEWRWTEVNDAVDEGRYRDAVNHLEAVVREFEGSPSHVEAAQVKLAALAEEDAVKEELKAAAELDRILDAWLEIPRRERDRDALVASLRDFAASHEERYSGERAASLARDLE